MTTFRSDIVAGITTMMSAYIAANPTLLRRHFRYKPPSSVTDTPFSYLDLRPETIGFDNSTRERILTADIVVLDRWTESGEAMDRLDDLADSLVTFISGSTYFHIIAGSWWSQMTIGDEDQDGLVGFRVSIPIHFMDGSQ